MFRWIQAGLLSLLSLLTLACDTATRVSYVHEPTADLQDRYEIGDPAFDPFRRSAVVVYPFFKLTERTKQMVVVRMIAGEETTVRLTGCSVAGQELPVDEVITLDGQPKPGVHRGSHVVGKLEGEDIERLSGAGNFQMRVDFQVGDAAPQTVTFDIQRIETIHWVSH